MTGPARLLARNPTVRVICSQKSLTFPGPCCAGTVASSHLPRPSSSKAGSFIAAHLRAPCIIAPFLVQKKVPQNSYQHIGTSGKLLLFASLLSACRTLA
jgi:hypothetical protein